MIQAQCDLPGSLGRVALEFRNLGSSHDDGRLRGSFPFAAVSRPLEDLEDVFELRIQFLILAPIRSHTTGGGVFDGDGALAVLSQEFPEVPGGNVSENVTVGFRQGKGAWSVFFVILPLDVDDRSAPLEEKHVAMSVGILLFALISVERSKMPGIVKQVGQLLRLPPLIGGVALPDFGMVGGPEEVESTGFDGVAKVLDDAAIVGRPAVREIGMTVNISPDELVGLSVDFPGVVIITISLRGIVVGLQLARGFLKQVERHRADRFALCLGIESGQEDPRIAGLLVASSITRIGDRDRLIAWIEGDRAATIETEGAVAENFGFCPVSSVRIKPGIGNLPESRALHQAIAKENPGMSFSIDDDFRDIDGTGADALRVGDEVGEECGDVGDLFDLVGLEIDTDDLELAIMMKTAALLPPLRSEVLSPAGDAVFVSHPKRFAVG